jgi:hypothetical protein
MSDCQRSTHQIVPVEVCQQIYHAEAAQDDRVEFEHDPFVQNRIDGTCRFQGVAGSVWRL